MTTKLNYIERYYDTHEIEGEEVTQSILHYAIIKYLISLLEELIERRISGIVSNINFYMTDDPNERPTSPDIAVIDGFRIEFGRENGPTSYHIDKNEPPPRLVFEISSNETWRNDLENKPAQYALMGVREYFAFDPNLPTIWTRQWKAKKRLIGWRLGADGQYFELEKDQDGRIWSEETQSWLVVEGGQLNLYSTQGELRLTLEEADDQRIAAAQQAQNIERQQREAAQRQVEVERQQRQAAQQQAQRERQRAEKLAELLRLHGIELDEKL